jgi:hypothetical protein
LKIFHYSLLVVLFSVNFVMHATLLISAALAGLASANPFDKRAVVTQAVTVMNTVTKVVSVQAATPTSKPVVRRPQTTVVTVHTTVQAPASANTQAVVNAEEDGPKPVIKATAQQPLWSLQTLYGMNYKQTVLDTHNKSRAKHGVAPLVWDDELFRIAVETARSCKYAHDTYVLPLPYRPSLPSSLVDSSTVPSYTPALPSFLEHVQLTCSSSLYSKTGGGGYGQNIAAGGRAFEVHDVILKLFYDEVKYYKWYGREPDMTNFHLWGHFSAIVWKESKSVACWTEDCSNRPGKLANVASNVPPFFTVCNFRKPGGLSLRFPLQAMVLIAC